MAKKRKSLVRILVLSSVFTFSTAAVASAHFCYVENKPNGAGAVTFDDIKEAGKTGKLVAPGAFLDVPEEGFKDVFIRGGEKDGDFIVGGGSMHNSPATVKGSPKNGVQKYHFEE
ncbi:hypothetical protein [Bacillus sp. FJAT-27245]|uniref:hypothetical protein n=1 Tax=Bacillus sp. FJAT-27245 TaxID=1684144 RepID=UPI0006A78792|nr:hypothetical protein [Bacillus sp. FJAT-27245]